MKPLDTAGDVPLEVVIAQGGLLRLGRCEEDRRAAVVEDEVPGDADGAPARVDGDARARVSVDPWPRGTAARPRLHSVRRAGERCTEVEVRLGPVGPQGDGLAEGPGGSACVLLRAVPDTLSHQLIVRVARPRGAPGCLLR